jgi:TFIIF-interacting CTD phosphatase-like protein
MHKGYFLKDLRVLAPDGDMSNIVLVDNNPVSFLCNPRNGIPVPSWYDDPADRALDDVLELLGELDAADDVRPVLDEKFSLKHLLATERARILDVVDPDECPN